ncbi:MAG: hypothetical protein PUC73_05935 [Lachnospiraceae bacterium]|nr:hypothetical protein [Lachnospiraceae bacterium]
MKKWNAAEIEELNIEQTAHNWTGIYHDGGYIGDGVISGHLSWDKSEESTKNPTNSDTIVNQLS